METALIFATVASPIVLAVIQLIKNTVTIKKNLVPLVSLVVGLAVGAVMYPFTDLDLTIRLWSGAFAGLSATGLFEIGNQRLGTTKKVES